MAKKPRWETAQTEDWMFGHGQVSDTQKPLRTMLAERFDTVTRRQVQTMQIPLDDLWEDRRGLTSAAALADLLRWFARTSIALCAIWFVGIVLTVYVSHELTKTELWFFSLTFVLIASWRFLLVALLIGEDRSQADQDDRSRRWRTLRASLLALVFANRAFLFVGPAMLLMLGLCIGTIELDKVEFLGKFEPGSLKSGAASFRGALTAAVWALPVIGVGLLRQAYVTLAQLLVERGQIQKRLRTLEQLEDNWKAGTTLLSASAPETTESKALADQIKQMRERFKSQYDRANQRFGEKSATNGALVAVVSLLGPFGGIKPDSGISFEKEKRLLKALHTEASETWPYPLLQADSRLALLDSPNALNYSDTSETFNAARQIEETARPCRSLENDFLTGATSPAKAFIHQTLLTANLMDCLERKNRSNAKAIALMQIDLGKRHEALMRAVQRIGDGTGAKSVRNTYVCVFPFTKHCVQDSQVDVSTEGLGKVAFDFTTFIAQVQQAEAALQRLAGTHEATLTANPTPLYGTLSTAGEVVSKLTKPRTVTVFADTEAAQDALSALIKTESQLPDTHDITVTARVSDAVKALDRVLEKLNAIPNSAHVTVTADTTQLHAEINTALSALGRLRSAGGIQLNANAGELYRELGFARQALEALPKRETISLSGVLQRPFININFPTAPSGGDRLEMPGSCDFLGARYFTTAAPLGRDDGPAQNGRWRFVGNDKIVEGNTDMLTALLGQVDEGKQLYVLGTADLQGPQEYNARLSVERAKYVADAISDIGTQNKPIALSLGDAGWLTWRGLPVGVEDASHRAAIIYACDRPAYTPGVTLSR